MRYTKFEFSNFRGLRSTTLDLSNSESGVHVLVGLNESGKTTVLEAIDHFRTNHDLTKKDPTWKVKTPAHYQAMIPIGERANFNGSIQITARIDLEAEDLAKISNFIQTSFGMISAEVPDWFQIRQQMEFKDSQHVKTMNYWDIAFSGRKKRGTFKNLLNDEWMKVANFAETLLPKIMYFPAHLLEFPDHIPLEYWQPKEKSRVRTPSKHTFYYQVIEDVLKAAEPTVNIETHILQRFRSTRKEDRQNIDALLLKAENHLNRTILNDWAEIFGQSLGTKSFRLILSEEEGLCSLTVRLVDSSGQYSMNERSAGFRWFFAFILLVRYRVHRNDRVLFLFDEPAANLHPKAQARLLSAFSALSESHQFVYSTHSHYLVNPTWLESTFVVKNDAVSSDDIWDAQPERASITISPYRQFVASHPDQTFYYKPIMDALEYAPAPLGPDSAGLLVEGKTDYFCLEYFKQLYFNHSVQLNIFPGGGAGSLDALIGLLTGWGQEFIILLDSDKEGMSQKKRYLEKFESLIEGRIFTIQELLGDGEPIAGIEKMFAPVDLELIRKSFSPHEKKLAKRTLHRAIQELLAKQARMNFESETLERFELLLQRTQEKHLSLQLV